MALSDKRWQIVTKSAFEWERNALNFIRERLPDEDPYAAWSNFDFLADDGRIYEVDLLILVPRGLYLIEIKSTPGTLEGDAYTWTWTTPEKRLHTVENPLLLANRKAKALASLLRRQKVSAKSSVPFITAIAYCSANGLKIDLKDNAALNVYVSEPGSPGIIGFLTGSPATAQAHVNSETARAVAQAMRAAGVRQSSQARKVGQYVLEKQLGDGPGYQDWLAPHPTLEKVQRRIHLYPIRPTASHDARLRLIRAAKREYEVLSGVVHPGILAPLELVESELGPALIFDYDPSAIRLDHYLEQRRDQLSVDTRMHLMRAIADAVRYAHGKKIVHRALSPESILVTNPDSAAPSIRVFDWQTGYRGAFQGGGDFDVSPTSHLEEMVEGPATAYIAPEVFAMPEATGETADVFSLGAIAYQLFSGQRPAENHLDLAQKLRESRGLSISAVVDGASEELEHLIAFATEPNVSQRFGSVDEFLAQLDEFENKLTQPEPRAEKDPSEIRPGDILTGGFLVKRRLGGGASALAFLVEHDGRESVLKIARTPDDSELLRDEADVLGKLRDEHFPELRGTPNFGGRLGILMSNAGDTTLAQRLRADGKLQIDMLERLGEDLLEALDYLDRNGIAHRDIKPGNIGIGQDKDKRLRLMLFDFSLSRAPAEKIHAGTRPYLEPFLSERKPPRWDPQAERYAAAVTLYEMATGSLPRWGDGQSDPALVDGEVTLDTELFDPHIRERLTDFFNRALRRNPTERFDNAEQMLKEWRAVFADLDRSTSSTDSGDADEKTLDARMDAALSEVTRDSTLTSLPFTLRAQSVLQRLNLTRVRDLLEMQVFRIYRLPGVGNRTRREIGRAWEKLYRHFAEQGPIAPAPVEEEHPPGVRSVDQIAREVVPARGDVALNVVAEILGTAHAKPGVVDWPSEREVATRLGIRRTEVADTLKRLRARWEKSVPALTALRADIHAILEREGGVMTIADLVRAVLTVRGSANPEPVRSANASAATRAAVEAERSLKEPSFLISRLSTGTAVVIVNPELADWATRLERSPTISLEPKQSLLPLACASCSGGSKRPTNLPRKCLPKKSSSLRGPCRAARGVEPRRDLSARHGAVRTLKLAQVAVIRTHDFTVEEFNARVGERYPKAARLPDRPYLDDLLKDAGLDFEWNPAARGGKGAYINKLREQIRSSTGSSSLTRYRTSTAPRGEGLQAQSALEFEERLERAIRTGAFLAIAVGTAKMLKAENEIANRFDVRRTSIDQILIRAMRAAAEKAEIKWPVISARRSFRA